MLTRILILFPLFFWSCIYSFVCLISHWLLKARSLCLAWTLILFECMHWDSTDFLKPFVIIIINYIYHIYVYTLLPVQSFGKNIVNVSRCMSCPILLYDFLEPCWLMYHCILYSRLRFVAVLSSLICVILLGPHFVRIVPWCSCSLLNFKQYWLLLVANLTW